MIIISGDYNELIKIPDNAICRFINRNSSISVFISVPNQDRVRIEPVAAYDNIDQANNVMHWLADTLENKNSIIKFVMIGLLYSLVFNALFYIIGNYTNIIDNNYSVLNSMELITLMISTFILGPILEEYLFRGVIYNKIKEYKFNNPYLLASLVFTISHMDVLSMIYAFIFSYILLHFYDKYKTIKTPLIIHVSANLMTLFLPYLFRLNIIYIIGIFIISSFVLIFYLKDEYKTK